MSKLIKKMRIPAIRNSKVDRTSRICSAAHLAGVTIGRYSYVGNDTEIIDASVGNFCSISDNCVIGGSEHPIDWVSTSPVFHAGRNILRTNFAAHPFRATKHTIIGNDVWIGGNCLVKAGVRIGDGAIIGMGSVLTKSVGDYEIWAGNPARLLRKRFSDDVCARLAELSWWNWDDAKIKDRAAHFSNIDLFLKGNP